jgi:hypothetical protein
MLLLVLSQPLQLSKFSAKRIEKPSLSSTNYPLNHGSLEFLLTETFNPATTNLDAGRGESLPTVGGSRSELFPSRLLPKGVFHF